MTAEEIKDLEMDNTKECKEVLAACTVDRAGLAATKVLNTEEALEVADRRVVPAAADLVDKTRSNLKLLTYS